MSPLLQQALGSIIRWVLALGAGYLVQAGIWTESDTASYLTAAALGGTALLWSLWQKYKGRLKFLTALEAPSNTPEAVVDAKVNSGTGASLSSPMGTGGTGGVAIVLAVALASSMACQKTPPDLTPAASVAFKGTQAVKALDLLRDTAVTANAQNPPVLDEDATRKVVLYHQSSVKIIQASPNGWQPAVNQGLDEVLNNLKPGDRALLSPYVTLIKTILAEVTR